MTAAAKLHIMMIEADMESALEAIEGGQFEAALLALDGARIKIQLLADSSQSAKEPNTKQITLDV